MHGSRWRMNLPLDLAFERFCTFFCALQLRVDLPQGVLFLVQEHSICHGLFGAVSQLFVKGFQLDNKRRVQGNGGCNRGSQPVQACIEETAFTTGVYNRYGRRKIETL